MDEVSAAYLDVLLALRRRGDTRAERAAGVLAMRVGDQAHAIVVGGGIVGLAVAQRCVARECCVTLVDPGVAAGVASRAAGAMLGAFGEITVDARRPMDVVELEFRIAAQDLYKVWLEELTDLTGAAIHAGMGTFVVATAASASDHANVRAIRDALGSMGRRFEWV